jgi:hypothetical protein
MRIRGPGTGWSSPQPAKAVGCQLGVFHGVLDALVPQKVLHSPGVDAFVGQGEAAGVPEHVRVDRKFEFCEAPRPLHQFIDRRPRQRPTTLRGKHERTVGVVPSNPAQRPQLVAVEVMGAGVAVFRRGQVLELAAWLKALDALETISCGFCRLVKEALSGRR